MRAALLIAAVLSVVSLGLSAAKPDKMTEFPGYDHSSRVSKMAAWDEQETMLLAQRHTVQTDTGVRARRLLPIALLFVLTLGHGAAMPYLALVIAFVGNLLLAGAVASMLPQRKWLAGFVVWLPPLLWASDHLMSTTLGLGLALWGYQSRNQWLLLLAGFEHETMLAFALVRRKVMPIVVVGSWALIAGLVWGFPHGTFGLFSLFTAAAKEPHLQHYLILVVTLALGLIATRRFPVAWIYLAFALVIGPSGAYLWTDFARLLSPLWVLGFITIAAKQSALAPLSGNGCGARAMV